MYIFFLLLFFAVYGKIHSNKEEIQLIHSMLYEGLHTHTQKHSSPLGVRHKKCIFVMQSTSTALALPRESVAITIYI